MGCVQSQEPQRQITNTIVIVMDESPLETAHQRENLVGKMVAKTGMDRSFVENMYNLFFKLSPDGEMSVFMFVAMFQAVHEQKSNEHLNKFLTRLYLLFDRDQNGHVDFEEFVTMLKVIINGSTAERLAAIFNLCDTDKNGQIDRMEFLTTIECLTAFVPGSVDMNGLLMLTLADSAFDKMNITGSGAISCAEFIASLVILEDESVLAVIRMLLAALTRVVTGDPPIPKTVHVIRLTIERVE